MSSYNPPIENVPIFDSSLFRDTNSEGTLTITQADKRYLKFPIAQGNETLQGATIQGVLTANGTSTFNSTSTFKDIATFQTTSSKPLIIEDAGDITKETQEYQSGTTKYSFNNNNGGGFLFRTKDSGGTIVNVMSFTPSSYNVSVSNTAYFSGGGGYFESSTAGGLQLVSTSPPTSSATQPASSDSSTNMPTTAWVQGAVSRLLSLNNTWTGTNAFNNASPPTSTATQPAFNDSSTKIPTTAWVQGAISGSVSSAVPVGSTIAYAGANTPPTGWLFCQGQAVSRTTYSALFAVIGSLYGNGDGSTTFNLPKMMSGNNNYGIFPAGSAQTTNNGFIVSGDRQNIVYLPRISNADQPNQKIQLTQLADHTHTITFPTANYVNNVNTTNNTSVGGSGSRAVNGSQSTFPTATNGLDYGNLGKQADFVPTYTAFCWIIKF